MAEAMDSIHVSSLGILRVAPYDIFLTGRLAYCFFYFYILHFTFKVLRFYISHRLDEHSHRLTKKESHLSIIKLVFWVRDRNGATIGAVPIFHRDGSEADPWIARPQRRGLWERKLAEGTPKS